jgi:hypothetical protein
MTTGKPVRITFPSYDIGGTDIIAGGKRVGFAVANFKGWTAYLFPVATDRRIRPPGCEEVTARTLRELRKVLRERVELKGPWWTA